MAMAFVRHDDDAEFDGFISIGMGATDYRQPMHEPFPLASMSVPVLDLFGDADYPVVLQAAPARLSAIKAGGHSRSAQRIIADAEHFFRDRDGALVQGTASVTVTVVVNANVEGICDRTLQVRDAIVGVISGVSDCADVTASHLAAIASLAGPGATVARIWR